MDDQSWTAFVVMGLQMAHQALGSGQPDESSTHNRTLIGHLVGVADLIGAGWMAPCA